MQKLRPLYWRVKKPQHRHRKHGEVNKDGRLTVKQGRLGSLTLDTRCWMLDEVLAIQDEINQAATTQNRPMIDLINDEELTRIKELIAANTYPEK